MTEPRDLPTGYYRVRRGNHPVKPHAPHWCVARWMPTCALKDERGRPEPGWLLSENRYAPPGAWDEIGEKVA